MSEEKKKATATYFVGQEQPDWRIDYEYSNYFSTKEKAIDKARSKAWKEGEDFFVYETIARVTKPDLVNTAKVETIS